MQEQRLEYLLERYSGDIATPAEMEELLLYIRKDRNAAIFSDVLGKLMERYPASDLDLAMVDGDNTLADEVLALDRRLNMKGPPAAQGYRNPFLRRRNWAWAASFFILLAMGGYLAIKKKDAAPIPVAAVIVKDVAPGRNGAILTLHNGSKVLLDTVQNGVVAFQAGVTAKVVNGGSLQYEGSGSEVMYNTITTPKGRQYQLVLPDGTRVWLNSASSLQYPTLFTGGERRVEVTGEAYFEVVKNSKQPFKVGVDDQMEVEVLGTGFNVNAYKNEANIRTTLIEGSVRVRNGNDNALLKPGQQAQLDRQGQLGIMDIDNDGIDKVLAWKRGIFNFNDASLQEVMRQLERWYNIDVTYEQGFPDIRFVGKISRDVSLASLLKGLAESKVHFRLEAGTRLVVLP